MSEPRSTRSDLLGAAIAGFAVVVFCLLLLWHDRLVFWNDDYELSVLPVFADIARSWSEGHLPLLSPYSWVCSNLAGEFQYGTFSIFVNAAIVLIWKFPLAFPEQAAALSIAHLFVLAAGAFLLTRSRKLSVPLAMFVALIAALNGWIICWGATDWFGALGAFTWLPWAWWACEKSLRTRSPNHGRPFITAALWPAPFVYLLVTGGFPYTILMLLLLIAWLSLKSALDMKRLRPILPMLLGTALGFGLSAPAWLALFDYIQRSARTVQPASAHWQWIVPWGALPALILPCWTVPWADFGSRYLPHSGTELACGLVAPAVLVSGFITRGSRLIRQIKWELLLLLVVLVLSTVPMISLFRWSFRWLPFFHLVLAVSAAEALQMRPRSTTTATTGVVLVGATAIIMLSLRLGGHFSFPLMWILLVISVIWLVAELFLGNDSLRRWLPAAITFATFLATYVCIPPNCGVPKYNFSQDLLVPAPLDPERLYLSVYPPPELNYRVEAKSQPVGQIVRPGSTSMWAGLHFINGYSPIRAAGVAREFNFAIHGEIDPGIGESLIRDQSGALARLGIDGLVIAQEVTGEPSSREWQLVFANEEGRVFHRSGGALARVRSVNWIDSLPGENFASAAVSDIDDSRNSVAVKVDIPAGVRPALLTFSRPFFPGYEAKIGNHKLRIDSYRGLFPIVEVPSGSQGKLTLTYRPRWLVYGGAFSIFCAGIFLIGVAAARRR